MVVWTGARPTASTTGARVPRHGALRLLQDASPPAGTNDALTPPKYAHYLADNISDSELHVIEGAGHMLVMERVAEVSEAIEGFAARF